MPERHSTIIIQQYLCAKEQGEQYLAFLEGTKNDAIALDDYVHENESSLSREEIEERESALTSVGDYLTNLCNTRPFQDFVDDLEARSATLKALMPAQ